MAVVSLFIEIRFQTVPLTVQVAIVWVVAAVKRIECAAVPVSLNSANVFDQIIVFDPVPAHLSNQRTL